MPGYDLHTHSTHSDGTTRVADNVAAAAALGLDGIAVTDHDTTASFDDARAAAEDSAIDVIVGTEFSAEVDGLSVHVLGLWVDPYDEALIAELARLRNERADRARRIVAKFQALGVAITESQVAAIAGDAPVGRPHIAQAVVDAGVATTIAEVFDRYLADGGPAYVEKHAVDPVDAVTLLVAAGGVAILAHPGLYGDRTGQGVDVAAIEAMATAGLAGIEADHPDHDEATRDTYRTVAERLGLEVTGGSDFHGSATGHPIGAALTPPAVVGG
ncbi:MAG: PHP domain-containing protein, partial [Nitriliruptoraceae bacterium]